MRLAGDRLRPGLVDEPRLRLAADKLCRRVTVDAGDVDGRRGGCGKRRQRRLRGQWRDGRVAVGVFVPRTTFPPSAGLMTAGCVVSSR